MSEKLDFSMEQGVPILERTPSVISFERNVHH